MTQLRTADDVLGESGVAVLLPGTPGYEAARRLWNGMIDRRPRMILQPRDVDGVAAAVRFAREVDLPIAVKCGGHSAPGYSVCDDDGLVVDLSAMSAVSVDAAAKRATVQGGALLRGLDEATAPHGLVVPAGAISHTGAGGLILGGGFGNLMRKFGLTIDSLESVQMVLADGQVVEASETENADLFWAVRGGSGNFGIVTEFRLRCHDFGPDVYVAASIVELEHAEEALRVWRSVMGDDDVPDDLSWISLFRGAPEGPGFEWVPDRLRGVPVLLMPLFWAGDVTEGERVIGELVGRLPTAAVVAGVVPWVASQQQMDHVFVHGRRHYAKAGFLDELPDDLLTALVECAATMPHPSCQFEVLRLGGAVARVGQDATAFPHRQARWPMNIIGLWDDVAADDESIGWVRRVYEVFRPHLSGGSYVNFAGGDEDGGTSAVYGGTWERLVDLKETYDPDNVFRFNANLARSRA
ncbi:FAD-binding oxidoreductase [Goekera deserti]|uniref:FAD-binding oxidoreductase n=1 Tax=Goekera deserti TaxID=2497753 RepID=A0A7K3WB80_9ACTN|nr:FAD-binding oxidoreductase [Goekera deserti]NDI47980.1 FAD-binding protein [Goekera deserti]NEL53728.1 FAD-binding oxidoreductase [Goekera deserti]